MFTTDRRSLILGSAAVVVSSALSRGYAQAPTGPYKLDPLPYPTSKNEPYIDAQTMEIHHDRHAGVRFGLGVRHRRKRRQASACHQAQSGHAAHGRPTRADGKRRVGTRLLSEISKSASRLPQSMVERGELGQGLGTVFRRQSRNA